MANKARLFLFGDGASPVHDSISKLHKVSKTSPLLSSFFESVIAVLHHETARLPVSDRPPLLSKSILELSEFHLRTESTNTAITFVLTCTSQLGWLILSVL